MKRLLPLLLTSFSVISPVLAQDDYAFSKDELFELSPFEVSSISSRVDPRYRGDAAPRTPISIKVRADVVMLRLTASCSDKRPEDRIEKLQKTIRALKEAAAKQPQVHFTSGYTELPLAKGRRSIFSSAGDDEVSSFAFALSAKLGEQDSLFDRMAFLNGFIDSIDLPDGVKVYYVSSGIALLKPGSYREEVLKLIGDEYRRLKTIFGDDVVVNFQGLDQRLQMRQVDEIQIELYLPYSMNLQAGPVK